MWSNGIVQMLVPSPTFCTAGTLGQPYLYLGKQWTLTWKHQAVQWSSANQRSDNQTIVPSKVLSEQGPLHHPYNDNYQGQHTKDTSENWGHVRLARLGHLASGHGQIGRGWEHQSSASIGPQRTMGLTEARFDAACFSRTSGRLCEEGSVHAKAGDIRRRTRRICQRGGEAVQLE